MEAEHLVDNLRREKRWFFPPEALREAFVNALAHRDWTRPREMEVILYSDRMDITSPGSLPNSMTVEKMLAGQRSPRNPIIISVLRDYGYLDAGGMGVRTKIVPLVRKAGGAEPIFKATEDYVRVELPKAR